MAVYGAEADLKATPPPTPEKTITLEAGADIGQANLDNIGDGVTIGAGVEIPANVVIGDGVKMPNGAIIPDDINILAGAKVSVDLETKVTTIIEIDPVTNLPNTTKYVEGELQYKRTQMIAEQTGKFKSVIEEFNIETGKHTSKITVEPTEYGLKTSTETFNAAGNHTGTETIEVDQNGQLKTVSETFNAAGNRTERKTVEVDQNGKPLLTTETFKGNEVASKTETFTNEQGQTITRVRDPETNKILKSTVEIETSQQLKNAAWDAVKSAVYNAGFQTIAQLVLHGQDMWSGEITEKERLDAVRAIAVAGAVNFVVGGISGGVKGVLDPKLPGHKGVDLATGFSGGMSQQALTDYVNTGSVNPYHLLQTLPFAIASGITGPRSDVGAAVVGQIPGPDLWKHWKQWKETEQDVPITIPTEEPPANTPIPIEETPTEEPPTNTPTPEPTKVKPKTDKDTHKTGPH